MVQIEDAPSSLTFEPDEAGAEALRERFQLHGKRVVVYTGNFEAYQGLSLLLDAVPVLVESVPDARLLLVGGEDRHRAALEQQVKELGIGAQVCFTGPLPMDRMPACMTVADALVSPRTQGTNTALKLYGYMQTGRPIVATDLETHTQALDESCAWLVSPEPSALAGGLAEALALTGEPARRGEAAAERVERNMPDVAE